MIAYVRGELIDVDVDHILVEAGGIGYQIFMPGTAIDLLPPIGDEVKIHTYYNVKEDAQQLFGFLTKDDLSIFKLVIGVSGIGPKGGLNIISQLSPDELRFAVLSGDVKAIAASPGIGKKTAEKLIIELKDKLNIEDALEHAGAETKAGISSQESGVLTEAVQALVALGYSNAESLRAVKKVSYEDENSVENVLKQALKYLM